MSSYPVFYDLREEGYEPIWNPITNCWNYPWIDVQNNTVEWVNSTVWMYRYGRRHEAGGRMSEPSPDRPSSPEVGAEWADVVDSDAEQAAVEGDAEGYVEGAAAEAVEGDAEAVEGDAEQAAVEGRGRRRAADSVEGYVTEQAANAVQVPTGNAEPDDASSSDSSRPQHGDPSPPRTREGEAAGARARRRALGLYCGKNGPSAVSGAIEEFLERQAVEGDVAEQAADAEQAAAASDVEGDVAAQAADVEGDAEQARAEGDATQESDSIEELITDSDAGEVAPARPPRWRNGVLDESIYEGAEGDDEI